MHKKAVEQMAEDAKLRIGKAWAKVLPFGAQAVASAAGYTLGVTATQLMALVCRVSCATPVLGPCMGLVGVGLANALAGHASRHTRKLLTKGGNPFDTGFWEPIDIDDAVLDAVLGICIFKSLGGRFNSLMPSDLSKPGAFGFESVPAKAENSQDYASSAVKRELSRMFSRNGCHHCGSQRGTLIGDHMPPNKLMPKGKDKISKFLSGLPGISQVRELMALPGPQRRILQRFYPQCQSCSFKQSTALRTGRRMLVLHWPVPHHRREWLAGVLVGLRHNVPPMLVARASANSCGRQHNSRYNPLGLAAEASADDAGDTDASGAVHPVQLLVQELQPFADDPSQQRDALLVSKREGSAIWDGCGVASDIGACGPHSQHHHPPLAWQCRQEHINHHHYHQQQQQQQDKYVLRDLAAAGGLVAGNQHQQKQMLVSWNGTRHHVLWG